MRKVSQPKKRAGKSGWWVSWFEGGKRKFKALPDRRTAEHFQHLQYHRLNADVFVSPLDMPWEMLRAEFMQGYDLRGRAQGTKDIAGLALGRFQKTTTIQSSREITQTLADTYILHLKETGLSNSTINRDIQRLKSFFAWAKKRNYLSGDIELHKLPVQRKPVKALTTDQIRALLQACPSLAWKVRILLSLTTGLRRNDIDHSATSALDLSRLSLSYVAGKTGKVGTAPIPIQLQGILERYTANQNGRLFDDKGVRVQWDNIRIKAGLYRLKPGEDKISKKRKTVEYLVDRQDFRRTFSTLIQQTSGLASAKDLLQHSSENVTLEYYTDKDLILRYRVNQLPVEEWMEGVI